MCFLCGAETTRPTWEPEDQARCAACRRPDEAQRAKMEAYKRQMLWEAACPPLYRQTDPQHAEMPAKLLPRVLAWMPNNKAQGLGLIGAPGKGKTRLMFLLVKKLIMDDGLSVFALSATAFARAVAEEYSDDEKRQNSARRAVEKARTAPIVFIDDIGKNKMTDRAEVELYDLLEERSAHMRPLLWTANGDADSLSAMMSKDRALPIIRRLKEFSEIITFT